MHEHTLNGIIHLFAVFASLERETGDAARARVEAYLVRTLGIHEPEIYLGLFSDLLNHYREVADPSAVRRGIEDLCLRLDPRLSRDEKQRFLLQALQIRQTLSTTHTEADGLLEQVAEQFRIPADELADGRKFVTATGTTPDSASCRRLATPGLHGVVLVFHSAWTGRFFLRILAGAFTLDENPLEPDRLYPVESGAILRDDRLQPVYRHEMERLFCPPDRAPPLIFEACNVAYSFPGGRRGLQDLSFCEHGGQLIGIMGGSGVGKSTLINILNGSLRPDTGRITLNGIDIYATPDLLEGVFGYVPQDDLLFEDLTVRENLDYNARLCLGHLTPEQRAERVQALLRELNQEEIAPLKVGSPLSKSISGGQRKRLNIALELIREPSVLFVDEPTSGLSSADSDVVMGLLKAQAARGKLVIVILHQPSSALFRLLDSLWILDRGGYPIYMGHPLEAARYFRTTAQVAGAEKSVCSECGNVNPEQLFSIIEMRALDAGGRFSRERKYSPEFWHEKWKHAAPPPGASHAPAQPPPRSLDRPSWLGQWAVFFTRTLKARWANRGYLAINLLEPPALAFLTAWLCRAAPGGTYTLGDNLYLPVYFFMAVIVAIFLGLSISAEEIVRDRTILKREQFLQVSWSAYAGAKIVYVGWIALIQTALCAWIGTHVLQLPGFTADLWMMLFASAVFGGILGLNISALFKSAVTVYILIPLLLLPQMLLGGLIIAYDDLRTSRATHAAPPIVGECMASRWAFEALVVQQFQSNPYQRMFYATDRELSRLDYLRNDRIPALIGRLDYLYLGTLTVPQQESVRRLLTHELAALEQDQGLPQRLADAAVRLAPPDRTGLDDLKLALRRIASAAQAQRQTLQARRQAIQTLLLKTYGEAPLAARVKQYTNRRIGEWVRNKFQLAPYRIQAERIIQLSDPIYQKPSSMWGRAPLMSGEKRMGPFTIDTYSFNLIALWIMNIVLALLLAIPRKLRT